MPATGESARHPLDLATHRGGAHDRIIAIYPIYFFFFRHRHHRSLDPRVPLEGRLARRDELAQSSQLVPYLLLPRLARAIRTLAGAGPGAGSGARTGTRRGVVWVGLVPREAIKRSNRGMDRERPRIK